MFDNLIRLQVCDKVTFSRNCHLTPPLPQKNKETTNSDQTTFNQKLTFILHCRICFFRTCTFCALNTTALWAGFSWKETIFLSYFFDSIWKQKSQRDWMETKKQKSDVNGRAESIWNNRESIQHWNCNLGKLHKTTFIWLSYSVFLPFNFFDLFH